MGGTPLGATSWPDAGHRVGRLLREVLGAGHAFLVVSEPGGRYVQFHAHPGGCWVEADSGAYSVPLAQARRRVLVTLGWPPLEGDQRPASNYGFDVEAPVDVYRLVLLLMRTLADAYDASPEELGYVASACRCEQR